MQSSFERQFLVLVTNDDGHDSPLLPYFLDAITQSPWCKELRAVIPAREQSWIGKGMTRFDELSVTKGSVGSHPVMFATGTPADCVSLGIHNLFPEPPELILSGINMGVNAGVAYFYSSGTVGGALEGSLARLPAIAASAEIPSEIFFDWRHRDWKKLNGHHAQWKQIAEVAVQVCSSLVERIPWADTDLFSVNLPWSCSSNTEQLATYLEPTGYRQMFTPHGDGKFVHTLQGLIRPTKEELENRGYKQELGDLTVVEGGKISVTPISFRNPNLIACRGQD